MNGTATDQETPTIPPTAETAASSSLPAEAPTPPLSVGAAEPSSYVPPDIPAIPTPIMSGGSVLSPDGNSATLVNSAAEPPSFSAAATEPNPPPSFGTDTTANSINIPNASSSLSSAGGEATRVLNTVTLGDVTKSGLPATPLDSPVHSEGGIPVGTAVKENTASGWRNNPLISWIPGIKPE